MGNWTHGLLIVAALGCGASGAAAAAESNLAKHIVGDLKSGYVFAKPETRQIMDDDFANPGFLWVEKGEAQWTKAEGSLGKSCATCHGDVKESMKGIAARYPVYDAKQNKLMDIEQRINACRTEHMKSEPLKWESDGLLGLTALIKLQSRGMPVKVTIDGPAKPFWEKGKEYYFTRRGQLDLACSNCHVDNEGRMLRDEELSQGQSNGFPTYRLAWQKLGSLQRRFRQCNSQIRAEELPFGADDYVNLELYLASRGQGLPVESPSVRK